MSILRRILSGMSCVLMAASARAETSQLLSPGALAPDFSTVAHDGTKVELAKLKGYFVVLYWYPKDDTPGCTKEAQGFRDHWDDLRKAGVRVLGLSTDSNESHEAFASKYKLPFPLLADKKGEIARKYGVPLRLGMTQRITYLIDKDGKIKHVWPKVTPVGHANEILQQVSAQ
jgi:peroxiredoxin Q/BCP